MVVDLAFDPPARTGPEGTPLVLLHAFPLDRSMWDAVAHRLRPITPVVTVDLPGLGASPLPPGEPSLDVTADAVAAVLDRLGAQRAVLAGISMGGYAAMAFARRHRHRLAGLALLDTRPDADAEPARQNRLRMADAVLGEAGNRALVPMLDTLLGATTHRTRQDVVATVRSLLAKAPPSGVAWSQRAMAARPDSTAVLAGLEVPAVVVVGAEDTLSPPEVAQAMAATLPDAVFTDIPGAGHLSALEAPDEVVRALIGLLLRVRPRTARS